MKFSKYEIFHSRKCIWRYHLRNGGNFVQLTNDNWILCHKNKASCLRSPEVDDENSVTFLILFRWSYPHHLATVDWPLQNQPMTYFAKEVGPNFNSVKKFKPIRQLKWMICMEEWNFMIFELKMIFWGISFVATTPRIRNINAYPIKPHLWPPGRQWLPVQPFQDDIVYGGVWFAWSGNWEVLEMTTSGAVSIMHIDGLVQERHNSIANALELCLSCTNPSKLKSS